MARASKSVGLLARASKFWAWAVKSHCSRSVRQIELCGQEGNKKSLFQLKNSAMKCHAFDQVRSAKRPIMNHNLKTALPESLHQLAAWILFMHTFLIARTDFFLNCSS